MHEHERGRTTTITTISSSIERGPLEDNPIWLQDHVTLISVGIDIGSSGTQVIFSRINLRRSART